ncbi:flagellar assembly protein FliW [Roseisolibacter sp. H3M3-2]|uniref:flagellar assembly protein FliW n=1 Tax=Roseisolibacter sp. H3M3-2 TaxID=3031323 RepID=UPI0023DC1FCA|nr:flagellar assembly protein FliW [Roseisolibacter sp. H3M3-2]MDF1503726.1 flagellar assembly protein FliW [Roseisolibacter sp. H3M3-2]
MTAVLLPDAPVSVASDLLGPIEVPAAACYDFPDGLPGFEGARRFALVPAGREGLFWLQSLDAGALVFLLADPFRCAAAYEVELSPADREALGAAGPDDVAVLAIVTLPRGDGDAPSVNLRAPVLLATAARRGRQVVRSDDRYGITEPLSLD